MTRTFQSYLPISVYPIYLFKDRLNLPSSETTSPKPPSASPPWELAVLITVGRRKVRDVQRKRIRVLSITGPALEREHGLTNRNL